MVSAGVKGKGIGKACRLNARIGNSGVVVALNIHSNRRTIDTGG